MSIVMLESRTMKRLFGKISLWIRKTKKSAEHCICIFEETLGRLYRLEQYMQVKKARRHICGPFWTNPRKVELPRDEIILPFLG
jgi:hypothetical protein